MTDRRGADTLELSAIMLPFPYKDENPSASRKTVIISLIGINVLGMFFWNKASYMTYGFIPAEPEPYRWITHLFLHGGMAHLIGNMWFLWIFGDNVEGRMGRGFLPFYLAAGFAATYLYAFLKPDSPIPLVGASGAISGVIGAYLVLFPSARVRCVMFIIIKPVFFSMSAMWFGFVDLVWQSLMVFLNSGSNVAYGAHLGGIVFGMVAGSILRVFDPEETVGMSGAAGEEPEYHVPARAAASIGTAISAQEEQEAVNRYVREVRRDPYFELPEDSQLWMADRLSRAGRPHLAKSALEMYILRHPRRPLAGHALLLLGAVEEESFEDYAAAVLSYERAIDHRKSTDTTRSQARERLIGARKVLAHTFIREPVESERYWILLESTAPPSPSQWRSIGYIFGQASDTLKRRLHLQPGFIAGNLSKGDAVRISSQLESIRVPVLVLAEKMFLGLPKTRLMTDINVTAAGVELEGPGQPAASVTWDKCLLIVGAALKNADGVMSLAPHPFVELIALDRGAPVPVSRFRWAIMPPHWGSREAENRYYQILTELVLLARKVPVNQGAQTAFRRSLPDSAILENADALDAYVTWHLQIAHIKKCGVYQAWKQEAKPR